MDEPTKKCTKCGKVLPISEMRKHKTGKYGVASTCKTCWKKYRKKWIDKKKREIEGDENNKHHGTYYGYVMGCRCDRCRNASNEYQKTYRRKTNEAEN